MQRGPKSLRSLAIVIFCKHVSGHWSCPSLETLCRYGAPGEGAEFASQAAGEREREFSHRREDERGQELGQTAAAIWWDWTANI